MDQAEFDRFADEYRDMHRKNIAITGEEPDYFAEYKIKTLHDIVDQNQVAVSEICDFGSGVGNSIPFFQKYFPAATVTCSDVSEKSLALSQSRFPGVGKYSLIERDHISAAQDAFDITFSACVFHHIAHDEHVAWLGELHRITRRGGLLAIFEHNPLNPLTVHAVNTCPFDENAKLIFPNRLKSRFEDAGWTSPSIQFCVFFPRRLAWLRPLERRMGWLPLGAQYVVVARKA